MSLRDELYTYLKAQKIKDFAVSDELPYTKDGSELFLKNFKRIYIDRPETTQEPAFNTLNGKSFVNQTTEVIVYLAVDAKNQPSNYDDVLTLIKGAKNQVTLSNRLDRTVGLVKRFDGDALVAEVTFSFKELLTQ